MEILQLWKTLDAIPGGKHVFSFFLRKKIPYSGTIGARVQELSMGKARVSLRDRRKVRNHLRSIHAVALMNLAELTTGLAMVAGLPKHLRAILVKFQVEYVKKARGTITAESYCDVPTGTDRVEREVAVELRNSDGETVCRARATWLIGPL